MDSTTILALLLPAAMAIFACALMAISRFDLPAAFAWGLGLGLCAAGFATSVTIEPAHFAALVSDVFFISGFFFYAEAFLIHFSLPLYRRERLAFAAVYLIINFYVVLRVGSLQLELLLNDVATSCLLGFALVRVMHGAVSLADRALVFTGSIVVVDSLIRVLAFVNLGTSTDRFEDFSQSSYAVAMEVTTSIIGVFYVLSIAGALADRVIRQLRDVSERDPLTGLLNRRGLDRAMAEMRRKGRLEGAVLICDIDHFKRINDSFGHAAGDAVITALADELRATFGSYALSARFGGEEFVSFVPRATLAEAGVAAQSARLRFGARDWRHLGIDSQITLSFGAAMVAAGETTIDRALGRADACLYAAKNAGRNQVVLEGGRFELKPPPAPETAPASNVVFLRRSAG